MDNGEVGNGILSIMTQGYPDILESCKASAIGLNPVVVINYTGWTSTSTSRTTRSLRTTSPGSPGSDADRCGRKHPVRRRPWQLPGQPGLQGARELEHERPVDGGGTTAPHPALWRPAQPLRRRGGSGGAQWYDLWLHLQPDDKFENWELGYENTGGLDPAQNTQGGLFNAVECSISADGTVTTGAAWINGTLTTLPQTTIATPYGSNQNRWQYNNGDPICFILRPQRPRVAQQGA